MANLYRKKNLIEAYQIDGKDMPDEFVQKICFCSARHSRMHVHTLEGEMTCFPGDWLAKGVAGEFYVIAEDIFNKSYERVEESRVDARAAIFGE